VYETLNETGPKRQDASKPSCNGETSFLQGLSGQTAPFNLRLINRFRFKIIALFDVNQKRLPETARPNAPKWPYTRFDWAVAVI
jgi:hypothetical protein